MKIDDIRKWKTESDDPTSPAFRERFYSYLIERGMNPDNLYQELEMSSPYVDTHQDTSDSNNIIQLHSHSFYELLYCCNTCGIEYLVGAERYCVQKGDIVLVSPGISHRPLHPRSMPEPYHRYVLWFNTEFLELISRTLPDSEFKMPDISMLRTAGTKWEILGDYFKAGIQEASQRAFGWESAVVGNTLMLLMLLKRAILDKNTVSLKAEKPELLERVMAYVEEHLAERITLEDTAKLFYVSPSTISKTFRQKMDISFYRCVTQRRLIASKSLILQGLPLEAINERVGFADYSSFYRAFKQEYGISPRQFRSLQMPAVSANVRPEH